MLLYEILWATIGLVLEWTPLMYVETGKGWDKGLVYQKNIRRIYLKFFIQHVYNDPQNLYKSKNTTNLIMRNNFPVKQSDDRNNFSYTTI